MESRPDPATDLPALYRSVLDLVGELARRGDRETADRIRVAATEAYSAGWDESAARRLAELLQRALRALEPSRSTGRRGATLALPGSRSGRFRI